MTWYEIYDDCYINTDNIIEISVKQQPSGNWGLWGEFVSGKSGFIISGRSEEEAKTLLEDLICYVEKRR